MGLVNPQLEYNRIARQRQMATVQKRQQTAGAGTGPGPGPRDTIVTSPSMGARTPTTADEKDKEDRHNVLDFGKWFTWCQHCRHGGHAACLNEWFGDHGSCGVNGCDCACKTIN